MHIFGNWYPVTHVFGLHATKFLGVIADAIWGTSPSKAGILKSFLQESTRIVCDDLGLYRGAKDNVRGPIHFDLFLDQFTLASCKQIVRAKVEEETNQLCILIGSNFSSLAGGLANFCVIETIAQNIVISHDAIFRAAHLLPGEYTKLHIDLESHHSGESGQMYKAYAGVIGREEVDQKIAELVERFSAYWAKMHEFLAE